MSRDELPVLEKYVKENMNKNIIRPSSSQVSSPVLFVKKPGGGLRFCVSHRGLHAIIVKNRCSLPLISETWQRMCKAKIFSELDIIAAFDKIRMAKGKEWKTERSKSLSYSDHDQVPPTSANTSKIRIVDIVPKTCSSMDTVRGWHRHGWA